MKKKYYWIAAFLITLTFIPKAHCQSPIKKGDKAQFLNFTSIPMGGNSWSANPDKEENGIVSSSGVKGWGNRDSQTNTFFRTEKTGKIEVAIRCRINSGRSKIRCQLGQDSKMITISNSTFDTLKVGTFVIENAGYQKLIISGTEKSQEGVVEISNLLIGGEAADNQTRFVKDEFYWGRRGPSVHLGYQIPANAGDAEWFYNEITVPEGNDVQGSYFMANGFGEGYFGIQVNSPTERRILFSVWSPFKTDKPSEIPEDQKIKLLKKGDDVISGAFGNEGSGGQSYRKYYWKPGVTYRFLLKGSPSENNSTDYTAYFFAPEINHWELIASFRRPKTTTSLKRLHSFLENFNPEKGDKTRKGIYTNQWIRTNRGEWIALREARFTADATARKEARLDYSGGVENSGFFLQNCGFFNDKTVIDSRFTRPESGKAPDIDLQILP